MSTVNKRKLSRKRPDADPESLWTIVALLAIVTFIWYSTTYYHAPASPGGDPEMRASEAEGGLGEIDATDLDLTASSIDGLDQELVDIQVEPSP